MLNFAEKFYSLIQILEDQDYQIVIAKPNHDPGYSEVVNILESVKSTNDVFYIESPSRNIFINLLRNIDLLIGNSSLALLEAPTLKLPAINIGNRQIGRMSAGNVVFSEFTRLSFAEALEEVHSDKFRNNLMLISNPYGDGKSSPKVMSMLKSLKLMELQNKKWDPLGELKYPDAYMK